MANGAQNAAQIIAGMQAALAGGIQTSAQSGKKNTHYGATGMIVSEPIFGIGQKSGDSYVMGEAGTEIVTPAGGAVGGGASSAVGNVQNFVDLRGIQVFKSSDADALVNTIGARIAQSLLPVLVYSFSSSGRDSARLTH